VLFATSIKLVLLLTLPPFSMSLSVSVDKYRSCREILCARTRMSKKDKKWSALDKRSMSAKASNLDERVCRILQVTYETTK